MDDRVTYEFHHFGNFPGPRDHRRRHPMSGVCAADFSRAHQMPESTLERVHGEAPTIRYRGFQGEVVLASGSAAGGICAVFPLDRFSVVSPIAVAGICAFLRCRLVPMDGGPAVAPCVEALMADMVRRAIARIRPAGSSLYREQRRPRPDRPSCPG